MKVFNGRKLVAPLDDLRLWGDLTRRGASTRRPLPVKGLRRRKQEDVTGEKKFNRKREICFICLDGIKFDIRVPCLQ